MQGYIYILINPLMDGIVKIGKTSRDPVDRVKELSSATGVPTPFILVYKEMFHDCSQAEKLIHTYLEEQGHRTSNNREFFNIPVYEVIKVVQRIKEAYDTSNSEIAITDTDTHDETVNTFIEELLEKADDYYYGHGDELQDYDEALKYYEKATKAGSSKALRRIAKMYEYGESVKENETKAIEFFKKAARLGDTTSYGELANLYSRKSKNYHGENKLKCWEMFFEGLRKKGLNDTFWDPYIMNIYLIEAFQLGINVGNTDVLYSYKKEVIENLNYSLDRYKKEKMQYMVTNVEDALVFIEMLEKDE